LLQEAEQLRFLVNTDDAAAQDHYGLVWLGDGPIQPVEGKIFTVRATAAIAQAAGVWRNGVLTFSEQLPVTRYQVVGMNVLAASGAAGRLIFPDSQYRPGTTVDGTTQAIVDRYMWRAGAAGVFGEFHVNQPPQLEMFAGTATAQTVYLDLIRKD
jgi:hypothetical protein